jgi:hypothetical protein
VRIFRVTGTSTAPTTASIKPAAWSRSRISAEPDSLPVTLAGRAAHIDVDDVGAQLFRHARPFRHPARLAARQLYDEGSKIPANCPFAHAMAVPDQVLARHHLRGDQGGAQKMCPLAERQSVTPDIGARSTLLFSVSDRCE